MNPLVKKEIRLLLPSWLAVLSLAILLPLFLKGSNPSFELIPLSAFFGMILLGVDSFGREFSLGTFQSLLSQPIERRRIWRIKITVLFFAAALIMAGFFVSYTILFFQPSVFSVWRHYHRVPVIFHNLLTVMSAGGAVMLVGLVGGLWTTLLFRQAAAAFWITFLAPAGLLMLIFLILPSKLANNEEVFIPVLCGAGVIYIAAGFWFAHRLFHRAQDAAWTGGVVAISRWRYFESRSQSSVSTRHRKPFRALVKKEMQLQSISWFCAAALLALHLAVIVMRKVHGSFERDSLAGTASEFFWALWLIMPLIIGGTMVAEERRLGVTEEQFSLPASRRFQFALKFFPALIFGIVLGGFMPLLLEGFAAVIGAPNPDFNFLNLEYQFNPVIFICFLAPGLSFAGFFASTLAKSFLQALGAAVVIIVGCVLFTSLAGHLHSFFGISWNPTLTIIMAILTLIIGVPWLAYLNFCHFQERGRVWKRNVFGLSAATLFIFVSSAALYNRAWEVFEPAEPAHGPAKISRGIPPVLSVTAYEGLQVRLPDGGVWFDYLNYPSYDPEPNRINWPWRYLMDPLPKGAGAQRYVAGSGWRSASVQRIDFLLDYKQGISQPNNHVVGYLNTIGVKADGTLWVSEASNTGAWTGDKMNRFDNETNWLQLVRARHDVLLLKNDGTLWRWGWDTNWFERNTWQTNWPSLGNYQPHQMGTDSDWKEIWCTAWNNLAQKSDGSVWGLRSDGLKYKMGREKNLDGVSLRTLSQSGNGEMAYIRPDGTLWMSWLLTSTSTTNVYSEFVRVGKETNWTAVTINWQRTVALKSDGSLWQWHFSHPWDASQEQSLILAAQSPPARLGTHNDWVAIASTWQDVIALAADGSLWLWPNHIKYEQETVLKIPKQPRLLGSVFSTPE
jgi:ABC-type transport system involved in multi-copper enzyme maturation permease subunit